MVELSRLVELPVVELTGADCKYLMYSAGIGSDLAAHHQALVI